MERRISQIGKTGPSANSIGFAVFIGFQRVNLKAAVRQFVDGAFKNRELARMLFLDTALDPFKRSLGDFAILEFQ